DGDDVLEPCGGRGQFLFVDDELDGGVALAAVQTVADANQGVSVFGLQALGAVVAWGPAFADAGLLKRGGIDACCEWIGGHACLPVFLAIYAREWGEARLGETPINSSPRRMPGSRWLISLDSGFRRKDGIGFGQRFLNESAGVFHSL